MSRLPTRRSRGLSPFEDFIPYDAREAVRVRWGSEIFRLLPGGLDRPVAVIDYLELLAEAIDPVLVPEIGYGLDDVVEIVLRRVDHVAAALSPAWSETERSDLGSRRASRPLNWTLPHP